MGNKKERERIREGEISKKHKHIPQREGTYPRGACPDAGAVFSSGIQVGECSDDA